MARRGRIGAVMGIWGYGRSKIFSLIAQGIAPQAIAPGIHDLDAHEVAADRYFAELENAQQRSRVAVADNHSGTSEAAAKRAAGVQRYWADVRDGKRLHPREIAKLKREAQQQGATADVQLGAKANSKARGKTESAVEAPNA